MDGYAHPLFFILVGGKYAGGVYHVASGELLKLHATPIDVFLYVLEGLGIAEIGGGRGEIVAGRLVESFARVPHRLQNASDSIFRFLAREDAETLK